MRINIFGNISCSYDNCNIIDSTLFLQKHFLRTNYIENNIEKEIDLKNQDRIKKFSDPISIHESASKNYVDNIFNNPSIIGNNEHTDLNDKNITNAKFIQVNQLPQTDSHLTAKPYVDSSISISVNERSILRWDPNEKIKLIEQDSIVPKSTLTSPKTTIEIPTKAYFDSLLDENERSRRDLG